MTLSRRIVSIFPPCAGLFGAAGIAVSAAAAHLDGGSPASTAGLFLMVHAAALLGMSGLAGTGATRPAAIAGLMMALGTVLFSGELALSGLVGVRPVPLAAPVGGFAMMAGWLVLPLWAAVAAVGRRGRDP